jgi:hypothetical protein
MAGDQGRGKCAEHQYRAESGAPLVREIQLEGIVFGLSRQRSKYISAAWFMGATHLRNATGDL